VPRQVDRLERRRALADAVFAVVAEQGLEAVSLREVAARAGVSMGAVQHYFASKDEMLRFALDHLHARVLNRLQAEVGQLQDPGRRELIEAGLSVMLPLTEEGRQEAAVNVGFVGKAMTDEGYATLLRSGYERLLTVSRLQLRQAREAGELGPGIDPDHEAVALYLLSQGLVAPVVVGLLTTDQARAILARELDRIFDAP
jgi:TetR/AcrR family transcriptional repressor of bet genes